VWLAVFFMAFARWCWRQIPMSIFVDSAFDESANVSSREPGVVFDFRGEGELAEGNHFRLDGPFEQQRA
jgi:hypothetical protein